ncbi:MAG: ATP-grasp domain-containing protein [Acidimicrobiales bacterium]
MPDAPLPDTRPRLAIAYDITATSPMDLSTRLGHLCDLVWVVDRTDPRLGSMGRLLTRLGTVVDTVTDDGPLATSELVAAVAAAEVDGVAAYCDPQLVLAATLASELGLVGNPLPVVERLNDKITQREALVAAGIPGPAFVRISAGTEVESTLDAIATLTYPLVVKPVHGDSSSNVTRVADLDAFLAALDTTVGRAPSTDLIVEEYLGDRDRPDSALADYVSVEMIVQDATPVPLAVTGKFPLEPPFRETGNFMPHPLEEAEAAAVLTLAVDAATALGVRSGALHTEIKLTPDGPRVIEVNGRVGGGAIDAIHQRVHGRSLTELAAAVALGHRVELVAEAPSRSDGPFSYEFFVQPPATATTLRSLGPTEPILGVAGARTASANRSPGDALDWRRGSQGYVLQVGGEAPDRATLEAVPTAITAAAAIEYD